MAAKSVPLDSPSPVSRRNRLGIAAAARLRKCAKREQAEGRRRGARTQVLLSDIDQVASATPALAVLAKFAALRQFELGFLVLLGWLFGIEPLKRVLPGLATMKPTTAATFILSGILLFLSRPGIRSASNRRLRGALSLLIIASRPHTNGICLLGAL